MGSAVKSPCISECIMDNGVCTACGMTEKEANTWHKLSDEDRMKIVERLAAQQQAKSDNPPGARS